MQLACICHKSVLVTSQVQCFDVTQALIPIYFKHFSIQSTSVYDKVIIMS